jgi:hypothetical protein
MYLVSGCVRKLRRSNELHQHIKCLEAQGRHQTPQTVHALLRSFWILRYLLLPQRKAESVSVLHTSVLYEIRSFGETSWILRSKNNSVRTLYQVVYMCYGGLTELLPLNILMQGADPWEVRVLCRHFLEAGCGPLFPILSKFIFLPQCGSGSMESTCWTFVHAQTLVEVNKHMSHVFRV